MGGPYASKVATLGGKPTKGLDIPIDAVFLALFLLAGAAHMRLYLMNKKRGHKFIPSAVTFGFCMSRVVANIMRITWACYPSNVSVGIAASVFVAAGILLLFILNLIYAQRMLRAAFPKVGWSPIGSYLFKGMIAVVLLTLVMLITVLIQGSYTLDTSILQIDHKIQLYGVAYFAVIAFLPLPITILVLIFSYGKQVESFGSGSWAAKGAIVLTAGTLLCLGASFRAATNYLPTHLITDSPPYDSKACFYIFDFGIDITVVIFFLVTRVDQRFYVPDGSSKVRHFRGTGVDQKDGVSENASIERKEETIVPLPETHAEV
ncbi:hypothetical protein N7528_000993 [Penicillium herquei]|nr:hypothetical protein N7528_000993 [Penicillium herquei]